jgi:hypothetical protein
MLRSGKALRVDFRFWLIWASWIGYQVFDFDN